MKKHLLMLLGALIALPALARDFTYTYEGQTLTYTVIDEAAKTCMTKGRNIISGELVLPSSPKDGDDEFTLVEIGFNAFIGCSDLTSVSIPNSVTKIGSQAFCLCSGLTSVSIPNSVTIIDEGAFGECIGLTSITIPNSITEIGRSAFNCCSGLTSVSIPNSVAEIGSQAFYGCIRLTGITVDSGNANYSSIDGVLLSKDCSTLIQFPAGKQIKEYIIPDSVTEIGNYAFDHCSGFTSVIIPNSVTVIGNSAFGGCSGLASVTFSNSVTTIGRSAFSGCSGLTSVTIPNSVTVIGEGAFSGCGGLTSVTIPDSVTVIGEGAFASCSDLMKITVDPGNANYSSIDDVLFSKDCSTLIQFPAGKQIKEYIIPDSVTEIGSYAFVGCSGLTSVIIPNSVTIIGNSAFSGCSGLASVTIPNSVAEIGGSAFTYCTALTSVTIPNSVTEIGSGTFEWCSGLTSVTIPNSVTKIGIYAFHGCTGLTSVTYLAEDPLVCYSYEFFDTDVYENATLNYLKSAEEKIADAEPWCLFKNRIGRDADFKDDSSITEVRNSEAGPTAIYDMRGVKVGDSTEGLPKGIYIVRQGSTTRKIAI